MKKIAILGTRGIPACYGGFETFAEELSARLVARGHEVTVYCRKGNSELKEPYFKGVLLVTLPTFKHKYFDTVVHSFLSVWHVSFSKVEIVYICNAINSVFTIVPRLFGKKVIINVDGLEWKRMKWNVLGKRAYQASEWLATKLAHVIISDSRGIQKYYWDKFRRSTIYISYGAQKSDVVADAQLLERYCLRSRKYILYVSRLEPENNALIMIQAYKKVKTDMPLVIVGQAPYGKAYIQQLHAEADGRVRFLGAIYGSGYAALQNHAYIYLHGNEVGGTNPALLEAMVFGNCVIAIGVDFNREVLGESGVYFLPGDADDLAARMKWLLDDPKQVQHYRVIAEDRIRTHYSWDCVVSKYEELFEQMSK